MTRDHKNPFLPEPATDRRDRVGERDIVLAGPVHHPYPANRLGNADTAASMASNVLCHRANAFFRKNFHSRSIKFRFGE